MSVKFFNLKNNTTFALAFPKKARRDGRVVDRGGLENRWSESFRGFESLSLRKQGCKSTSYVIYTLFYTQKRMYTAYLYFTVTLFFILSFVSDFLSLEINLLHTNLDISQRPINGAYINVVNVVFWTVFVIVSIHITSLYG